MYQLEAGELKRVYDWAKRFEQHWGHQLGRIKRRAERRVRQRRGASKEPSNQE